jgi:hypothetical protein
MNKLIPAIVLIICSIGITSCGNSPTDTVTQNQIQPTLEKTTPPQTTNNQAQPVTNKQPQIGTVTELVTGDIICYATIVDEQGIEHHVGASFEICAESEKYLNKKVRASYEIASLNDCESIEPCGKSRQESIIASMEILDKKTSSKPAASNSQTLSNGKWTITIGNRDSWTGVNNTGNLTYKGCDVKGNCLDLKGGKVTCRDGTCFTGWVNGDYRYIWSQAITEDGNAAPTLIVKKGDTEILNATGFKLVPTS